MTRWFLTTLLLCSAHLLHARDIASAQGVAAASLSGVVLTDDATPVPVRHARVELAGPAAQSVITGDDGAFQFNNLSAGKYQITVDKLGVGRRVFSANRLSTAPTLVALAAGQQFTSLKVILPRGGVISGIVTDPAGAPVVGAMVAAIDQLGDSLSNPRRAALPIATTDDEGRYRLFGLAPGSYIVRVAPQGTEDGSVETYYPNVDSPREAIAVVVAARDERLGVDVVTAGGKRVSLSGSLRNSGGEPIDAVVQLSRTGTGADGAEIKASTRDGSFAFRGISPGSYELRAVKDAMSALETIDVSNRSESGIALVLRPSATPAKTPALGIGGSEVGGLRGRISNAAGQGAPELAIVVLSADRQKWATADGRPIIVWPDTNGDWSIEALLAGEYLVAALGEVTPADLARPDFLATVAAGSVAVGVKAGEVAVQDLRIGG